MLQGKIALVTGASRGIGRAIAKELARAGAEVVINYLGSEDKAKEVKDSIEAIGGKAHLSRFDVSKPEEVKRPLKKLRKPSVTFIFWLTTLVLQGIPFLFG